MIEYQKWTNAQDKPPNFSVANPIFGGAKSNICKLITWLIIITATKLQEILHESKIENESN